MKKAGIFGGVLIVLAIIAILGYGQVNKTSGETITLEEAKVQAVTFINDNLMGTDSGNQVTLKEALDEGGMYKIVVNMPTGQEVESYLSKDGKLFFPQAMDIAEYAQAKQASESESQPEAAADVPKSAKPSVELFVMSHCPYGTQIEKGILPVLAELGDSIDFELKFCDYAMHGKPELDEQLNQYCIQKENPDKLTAYLECFLADESKSAECITQTGLSLSKVSNCVTDADKELKITEQYNDKSTWKSGSFPLFTANQADVDKYKISGSPGLVINGQTVSSGRSPSALLTSICAAFDSPPDACGAELSAATPAPGFGYSGSGSDTQAGCGS